MLEGEDAEDLRPELPNDVGEYLWLLAVDGTDGGVGRLVRRGGVLSSRCAAPITPRNAPPEEAERIGRVRLRDG